MARPVLESRQMIPAEVTDFVGRRRDLSEVRRMLSGSRLVTLTGFGGVGKTRLAVQLANQLARSYPDGVCFVGLGDLSDPALIAQATASALQLHDSSGSVGIPELADFLMHRELLLVLDNCEHLIDDCADLVSTMLRKCPRLHVLATSRETLRVDGEAVWRVSPLAVPASGVEDTAVIHEYEAVRLLADRAMRAAPGFQLSKHNIPAIVEICRLLDGVPLALELAAVRLRALSAGELLEQLQGRWEALDVGTRGAPERHSAMTACLEWSYELCSQRERSLWSLVSVFAGGMEMPAVRHVAARADPDLADNVVELLQSLVDKSILQSETREGPTRYRMIGVIRQFGAAQLTKAGGLAEAQLAHRDWCAELLARCDDDWMSPRQLAAVQQVRREEQNIREALTTCWRLPDQAEIGLEMSSRLRKLTYISGRFTENRAWLRRFLPLVPDRTTRRLRGLRAAGWLAAVQGDLADADAWLHEASGLATELGPPSTWLVRQATGLRAMFASDLDSAVSLFTQTLPGLQEHDLLRERAETLVLLGMSHGMSGDLERAATTLQECLDLCASAGESWYRSYGLWFAGLVAWGRDDQLEGVRLVREGLQIGQQLEDRLQSALAFEALAWCQVSKSPKAAAVLLGSADALWDVMGTSLTAMPGLSTFHVACEASLQQVLGDRFAKLREQGRGLDSRSALGLAMGEAKVDRARGDPVAEGGASEPAVLTKRESEIAELVARGMTNREIAAQLVISPRTADTHLENILTKLGFTSRSQIAAWFSSRAK